MSSDGKPFECVGERRESAAAVRILSQLPHWQDKPVVKALAATARAMVSDAEISSLLDAQPALAFPDPDIAAGVDRTMKAEP